MMTNSPNSPPTTPPAMAPALRLLEAGGEDSVGEGELLEVVESEEKVLVTAELVAVDDTEELEPEPTVGTGKGNWKLPAF
jgi:hypothetical protein